jgi:predicted amidophosphoribosyltransferase
MATCHACLQQVEWVATRCAHCTSPLDGCGGRSPDNPLNGIWDAVGVMVVLVLACAWWWA